MGDNSPRNEDEVHLHMNFQSLTRCSRLCCALCSSPIHRVLLTFAHSHHQVPTIAVVGSGGGFRAMVGLSGAFRALVDTGVFDCLTYVSTLSGSSWCAHWVVQYSMNKTMIVCTHMYHIRIVL